MTFQQFISSWLNAPIKFNSNKWNFEVEAGRAGQEIFSGSFGMRRFNSSGSSRWASGTRNSRTGGIRGSLIDFGHLKSSITYKVSHGVTDQIIIKADPKGNTRSILYAATHNEGIGKMPERQFMPHEGSDSSVFDDKLEALEWKVLLKGFPKSKV